MKRTTILSKEEILRILDICKERLEEAGCLETALFVHTSDGTKLMLPLSVPNEAEAAAQYFYTIGKSLHKQRIAVAEAMVVAESWYVSSSDAPDPMRHAPHKHPRRHEAIIVNGRAADNNRYTFVVQPFTRDDKNRLIWQEVAYSFDNESQTPPSFCKSTLDYFFDGLSAAG